MAEHVDLLLSAGRGPQECDWAVAQLLRRLEADAGRHALTVHRIRTVPGDRPGTFRSALVRIRGGGATGFAASWTGTLCWQAPSPYRPGTARKNWYVIAQPCAAGVTTHPTFSESDVDIVGCRTGGPGGQHRDKASTAVRATHRPSGIVVVVDTERQFHHNRRLALERLRACLRERARGGGRSVEAERRRIHDDLVRGDPVRIERPSTSWAGNAAGTGPRVGRRGGGATGRSPRG